MAVVRGMVATVLQVPVFELECNIRPDVFAHSPAVVQEESKIVCR